jgi:hypothetical protein
MTLAAFFLLTLVFTIAALTPGIGYNIKLHIEPSGGGRARAGTTEGNTAYVMAFKGNVTANFNPLFYPLTFLTGKSTLFTRFWRAAESNFDYYGEDVARMVVSGLLATEFLKNLPLLLPITCLISLGLTRLMHITQVVQLRHTLASMKRPFHKS